MGKSNLSLAVALSLFGGQLLASNAVKIDEIKVVSATGYEQNIVDAPASISVISKEQLEKKSYENFNDVVKDVPGVFTESSWLLGGGIRIRGMGKEYTKILVDGVPLTKTLHNNVQEIPSIGSIERVEVIRGPMSSLYNSDALGGTINIITKKVPNKWTGILDAQYLMSKDKKIGDYFDTSAYVSGPIIADVLGLQINGLLAKRDEDKNGHGTLKRDRKNFGAKITWNATDRDELSFDYKRVNTKDMAHNFRSTIFGPGDGKLIWSKDDSKDIYNLAHRGKYDKLEMNTFINYDKTNSKTYHHMAFGLNLEDPTNLLIHTQGTYSFDTNILTAGFEYEREQSKLTRSFLLGKPYDLKKWNFSFFVEDDYFVTDDLTLTFGARVNKDKSYGTHFTPRFYANYHLNDNFVLKGGVSGGFKNPKITDTMGENDVVAINLHVKNPDLEPENSLSYEAGFNFTNNDNLDLNLMAFVTNFKDKIESYNICNDMSALPTAPGTWTCRYDNKPYWLIKSTKNIASSRIYGVELSLNYNILDNLSFKTNYTYSKSKVRKGTGKGDPINETPNHMLNVGVDYQALNSLTLWTQLNYKSNERLKTMGNSKILGSYASLDLGAVYKFSKNAQIRAGIYNLFDADINEKGERKKVEGTRFNLGVNVNF